MSGAAATYRVLLADADEATAPLLVDHLRANGVDALRVNTGQQALEMVRKGSMDAVVATALLPGLSGIQLAHTLKQDEATASLPVVLLTWLPSGTQEEAELQRQWKVDAVFRKPLAPSELLTRLDALIMLRSGRVRGAAVSKTHLGPRAGSGSTNPTIPPLQGECSLTSLAPVVVHAFTQRLTAVLEVHEGPAGRNVYLHDGMAVAVTTGRMGDSFSSFMVERGMLTEGVAHQVSMAMASSGRRFAETAASVAGVEAWQLAGALEDYQRWLLRRALCTGVGTFTLRAWRDNPVLGTRVRMDPLAAMVEACLALPSEDLAVELLSPILKRPFVVSEAFADRLLSVSVLRPQARVHQVVAGSTLGQAVAQAQSVDPEGARLVAGLVLIEALRLTPETNLAGHRRLGLLAPPAMPWVTPTLPAGAVFARQMVAHEFVRTLGRPAPEVLEVGWDATADQVRQALATLRSRLASPALDDADLGPATGALEMMRMRFEEAARVLLTPADRIAHQAIWTGLV